MRYDEWPGNTRLGWNQAIDYLSYYSFDVNNTLVLEGLALQTLNSAVENKAKINELILTSTIIIPYNWRNKYCHITLRCRNNYAWWQH